MGFLGKLFGGGKQEGQGMAAQILSQLTADLNLSGDQLEQMKAAFQTFREGRKAAKAAGGTDMKAARQEHRQQLKSTILNLLSEEQKQKFTANMDKYKDFFQR